MTRELFLTIMSDDKQGGSLISEAGCNALKGLLIVKKYMPEAGIEYAGRDVIGSVNIDKLIDAGITLEDVEMLRKQNWMVEDESYLACFV